MAQIHFKRSSYDSCVYFMNDRDQPKIFLLLYVDHLLIASDSKTDLQALKRKLGTEFEMKELGDARRILGMDIRKDRSWGTLFLI